MSTGMKFAKFAGMLVLCLSAVSALSVDAAHRQRKTKKAPPAPLPNGPTGPVQQIPLDSIAPVPPQVSYQSGQLTIVAPNSTLGDILRAVKKQTGAEIEIPSANDRVVTHLGPGSAREVIADLLNGSRFNYVLLGSAQDSNLLTRVVLVAKTGETAPGVNAQAQPQPGPAQAANFQPQPPPEEGTDAGEVAEDNPDDNPDQTQADVEQAEQAEQANPAPDQPGVKTPQQMLQEMQQRQLQLQQQQQQGQVPGLPVPGRAPQEQ